MDQTDFAIAMVSGVLIIIVIFLVILFKIFGKKKRSYPIITLLPETIRIEPPRPEPELSVTKLQEIEERETEFQFSQDIQNIVLNKETILELQNDIKKERRPEPSSAPFPQPTKRPIEDDELKLEDILTDVRNERSKKRAKAKVSSNKNLKKSEKSIEKKNP